MQRFLIVLVAALALLWTVQPAQASWLTERLGGSSNSGVIVHIEKSTTTTMPTAAPQATLAYRELRFDWDVATAEYPGTYPTGIGAVLRVYPNPNAGMFGIMGVVATPYDLPATGLEMHWDKSKNMVVSSTPGVVVLERESTRMGTVEVPGRFYQDIPLPWQMPPQCWRYYAVANRATRTDKKLDLVLITLSWVDKHNTSALTTEFRFRTEQWPGQLPSGSQLADVLRRSGNGGNGLVFSAITGNPPVQPTMPVYTNQPSYQTDGQMGMLGGRVDDLVGMMSGKIDVTELAQIKQRLERLEQVVAKHDELLPQLCSAVEVIGRNFGATQDAVNQLKANVANNTMTLAQVVQYLQSVTSTKPQYPQPTSQYATVYLCPVSCGHEYGGSYSVRLYYGDAGQYDERCYRGRKPITLAIGACYKVAYSADGRTWKSMEFIVQEGLTVELVL